jgi:hypothetical protein
MKPTFNSAFSYAANGKPERTFFAFCLCQRWLMVLVALTSQARSLAVSRKSAVEKYFALFCEGLPSGLSSRGVDQRGNVVRLAFQYPARLLRREPEGQLTEQPQDPMLIYFHSPNQSQARLETERQISLRLQANNGRPD